VTLVVVVIAGTLLAVRVADIAMLRWATRLPWRPRYALRSQRRLALAQVTALTRAGAWDLPTALHQYRHTVGCEYLRDFREVAGELADAHLEYVWSEPLPLLDMDEDSPPWRP
jgi:hypothetical protein